MRVLVFETKTAGHCLGFAAGYASTFAEAGHEVVFAVSRSAGQRESPHRATLDALGDGVHIQCLDTDPVGYRGVEQGRSEWRALKPMIDRVRPHRLVIPTSDAMADALAAEQPTTELSRALVEVSVDMVIHAVEAAHWPVGRRRFTRWRSGLRTLSRVGRIGRVMSCDPYSTIGPGVWPVRAGGRRPPAFIPHPLPPVSRLDREAARELLNWPNDRRLIVALGNIAKRRAAGALIASAEESSWPTDAMLVLAGVCTREARKAVDALSASARDRVLVEDRYLGSDEYAAAYKAADVIWAGSPHHRGMSATQWQAAAADRPAIVLDTHRCGRWLSERIGPSNIVTAKPRAIAKGVSNAQFSAKISKTQIAYLNGLTDYKSFKKVLFDE